MGCVCWHNGKFEQGWEFGDFSVTRKELVHCTGNSFLSIKIVNHTLLSGSVHVNFQQ